MPSMRRLGLSMLAGPSRLSLHAACSQGSLVLKATDMVLAFAIPTHMHITMNAVISDYLPKAARGELKQAFAWTCK
jgi:succinate dehydrogenase (ubiquinone) membrane anchor subunit